MALKLVNLQIGHKKEKIIVLKDLKKEVEKLKKESIFLRTRYEDMAKGRKEAECRLVEVKSRVKKLLEENANIKEENVSLRQQNTSLRNDLMATPSYKVFSH